jgi:competence protein ComFC
MNAALQATRGMFSALSSLIYPPCCEECGAGVDAPAYLCTRCAGEAVRISAPFCMVCSEPFSGTFSGEFVCMDCQERKFHFACAVAPYKADGVVLEFIHKFKYQRAFRLRNALAEWAAEGLADERIRRQLVDALVPVPLFHARRRWREFNQAREIALLVGRKAGIPVLDCLRRTRDTPRQAWLDRKKRMENLRNAFTLRESMPVRGRHLVLIDDVLTTGSTLDECARALVQGGAESVRAITVARG